MKILAILSLAIFVTTTQLLADDSKFQEHKAKALKRVEEHLAKLTEHKACIEGAADKAALKACHEKMKAWHEANRGQHDKH